MGRVRIRHGENEIELDGSDDFIQKHLEKFYERVGSGSVMPQKTPLREQLLSTSPPISRSAKDPTPAEFYRQKGSKSDGVSKILVFGKYLEQFREKPDFTQRDINQIAKDAKLAKDIHAQFFTNAVKQGLLRKQGQKYSLTLSAEELLADG